MNAEVMGMLACVSVVMTHVLLNKAVRLCLCEAVSTVKLCLGLLYPVCLVAYSTSLLGHLLAIAVYSDLSLQ